eukprot:comp24410_c0_seq1/m.46680 comp24410_c0_seq1/g.46680  ORF comp24410_c0_seq1/g.46680 comp24410_c0_seq1/m.46680 type:complete len:385 (-) comp24410_c0_seq1:527-1681(-)
MGKVLGVDFVPLAYVLIFHAIAFGGLYFAPMTKSGLTYMLIMYAWTGLGITVGYHRLWSHRAYKAILPWRMFWAAAGAGALQGSILWWSRLHRLHHSFPDTDMDPYGPDKGFWFSHCIWMFEKVDRSEDVKRVDVSDLKREKLAMLQHKYYLFCSMFFAFALPVFVFQDTVQAILYGGFMARILTWHSTWCVNSLAHWLGSDEYSNETSAKDHFFTALVTLGEGNHGFHHAFSFSYKNGVRWYDYDPTKRIIELGYVLGMCYDLKHPPENEIDKARYQVREKNLADFYKTITWPDENKKANKITLKEYQDCAAKDSGKVWVSLNGLVYDCTEFASEHPGGERLLRSMSGKKPEYIKEQFMFRHMHSKAARNLLDMMLIGTLVEN